MATLDDNHEALWENVARIALTLPETDELTGRDGLREWRVKTKMFAWERPLRKSDIAALGADAPTGPILGLRVADEGVKLALVSDDPAVYFTTPHFNGYPAVLVRLPRIPADELAEQLVEAWLARAPKTLARKYLAEHP